jgi:hypothetical protein
MPFTSSKLWQENAPEAITHFVPVKQAPVHHNLSYSPGFQDELAETSFAGPPLDRLVCYAYLCAT